ncbi:L,D-transpeptidase [Prosthecobacter sp.]|uniref:L,D-transpeptidase n=1 Tax=Prosthecobacter sp. TaxID=1965333 RepID=UPI003782EE05
MNLSLLPRVLTVFILLLGLPLPAADLSHPPAAPHALPADHEAATRLQVFLDRGNFGPGKIDGRFGGFSEKALELYREAHSLPPLPTPAAPTAPSAKEAGKPEKTLPLPDLSDMDLASAVKDVFTTYTVTEADVSAAGQLPAKVPEMAKLKWLPYATVAEAVAERFHVDIDYLRELNPGKLEALKAGDTLRVPNVEPFDLASVKTLPLLDLLASKSKDGKASGQVKEDKPKHPSTGAKDSKAKKAPKAAEKDPSPEDAPAPATAPTGPLSPDQIAVKVDTKDNMLRLFENEKLVAAYPVTIGSAQTESPLGEWKVKGVALLPDFRYDLSFLNTGERGDKTYLLHPGPNNPVGVIWVALNKPGIGLHGTSDPDAIGRSASHGCVRLANWDIARLATHVRAGVMVSIH